MKRFNNQYCEVNIGIKIKIKTILNINIEWRTNLIQK